MLKDHNAHYVERRFSIYKQKVLDRVHDIFNIANIPYGPVDFAQYPQFVPLIPQNCRLVVVDAKERGTSLLYKSKVVNPVDNVPVYDVCLLLHGEHYYALNSLSAWFGQIENKLWRYVFYDFECTQNTLDAETDRPVHKVNYCVAMSVCNKCTDNHPCEDCSQTQTFSGLKGRDALKDFCMWAFDDKNNQDAVFIAHNGSNYDSHFIISYLVENTEYPEILANGGKMLQMYIKTCETKFIDS